MAFLVSERAQPVHQHISLDDLNGPIQQSEHAVLNEVIGREIGALEMQYVRNDRPMFGGIAVQNGWSQHHAVQEPFSVPSPQFSLRVRSRGCEQQLGAEVAVTENIQEREASLSHVVVRYALQHESLILRREDVLGDVRDGSLRVR